MTTAWVYFGKSLKDQTNELEMSNAQMSALLITTEESVKVVQAAAATDRVAAEDRKKVTAAVKQLNDVMPGAVLMWDAETGNIKLNNEAIREGLRLRREAIAASQEQAKVLVAEAEKKLADMLVDKPEDLSKHAAVLKQIKQSAGALAPDTAPGQTTIQIGELRALIQVAVPDLAAVPALPDPGDSDET